MTQQPLLEIDPAVRRAFDYYPTPAWMTRALCRRMTPFSVVEPCSGDGAIVRAIQAHWKALDCKVAPILTNDLDPSQPSDLHLDATAPATWKRLMKESPYWGVTNVPFELADQIVPLAVDALPVFATVLRLSWLEPTKARQRFLEKHPPSTLIVMPRHDFKGRGQTDSVTSAWFIWEKGRSSVTQGIQIVTKDERDELIAQEGA